MARHFKTFTDAIKAANNTTEAQLESNYEKLRKFRDYYDENDECTKSIDAANCMRYLAEIYELIKEDDSSRIDCLVPPKEKPLSKSEKIREKIHRVVEIAYQEEKQRQASIDYMRRRGFDVSGLSNASADDVRSLRCWHMEVNPDPRWARQAD